MARLATPAPSDQASGLCSRSWLSGARAGCRLAGDDTSLVLLERILWRSCCRSPTSGVAVRDSAAPVDKGRVEAMHILCPAEPSGVRRGNQRHMLEGPPAARLTPGGAMTGGGRMGGLQSKPFRPYRVPASVDDGNFAIQPKAPLEGGLAPDIYPMVTGPETISQARLRKSWSGYAAARLACARATYPNRSIF
jgi:hypothetical protein